MEALVVSYVHHEPEFRVVPADHAIIRRVGSVKFMHQLAQQIEAGDINKITLIGPGVSTGWRLYVKRSVTTIENPTTSRDHATSQRQALGRIVGDTK